MIKDDTRICEAMVNWFESQEIPPNQVVSCMAQLLGVMIAEVAPNIGQVIKGSVLAHEATLNTALQAFAKKSKFR